MVRDSHGPDPARRLRASRPTRCVVRLRASGARDTSFGNGGLTYPLLGRPPGGDPIYTTFDAIDAAGSRASSPARPPGPGRWSAAGSGTVYTGRFALTVSQLQ